MQKIYKIVLNNGNVITVRVDDAENYFIKFENPKGIKIEMCFDFLDDVLLMAGFEIKELKK